MSVPDPRPTLTKQQREVATAMNLTDEQYLEYLRVARIAEEDMRVRGPRLEVADAEYEALTEVVALVGRLMPLLDEAGASHRQPNDYLRLRQMLADLQARNPQRYGSDTAVTELLGILDATGG